MDMKIQMDFIEGPFTVYYPSVVRDSKMCVLLQCAVVAKNKNEMTWTLKHH